MIFLCLVLTSWSHLSARSLDKRDFLISQDYSHSEQNNPSVAVGLDGRFAVVWVDYRSGGTDIFCRLYDSGAVEIGDDFLLNDDGVDSWQFEPDLSSDWYGNYFAVWKDYRNNSYPFGPDIYYQRLDSAGFVGANQNITIELPDSSHQSPAIGATGWGKTMIAWTDLRHRNWDVFIQSLDTDGNPIGSNLRVNDDNLSTPQHEPDVALSAECWFVIVWYDGRNGNDDIYMQKYDSSGVAIGVNIRINDDGTASKQKFPSVAIGGNGVIFVVWADWRNGNYPDNPDIYAQRLDSNLNRLGSNFLVNLDGAQTAQRNAKVAADRMGNACIVWSDSSAFDWEIKGQMFDHTGSRHDDNFNVNLDSDGKQLHPDIALDGYYLYLTWADDRGGDYDIYGRLLQYNDPSLIAMPSRIDLSKDKNDPDPEAVWISLDNAGYGELQYSLETDQSWITLSKTTGTTPDSFFVLVNTDFLDYGTYQGRVKLIDILHQDSAAFIPIFLSITGPLIDIEPDSLHFKALAEIGPPSEQTIIVHNSGSSEINFNLRTTTNWLRLNKLTGTNEEIVRVGCDISSLVAGEYQGFVIVTDEGALNNPESLGVSLTVHTNMPYMVSLPPEIKIRLYHGETMSDSVRIVNLGSSVINWQASCDATWAELHNDSGQENDVLAYTIVTAPLDTGVYLDSIVIRDSLAFNNPLIVPIEVSVSVADTVVIIPAQARIGEQFQTPLYLHSHNALLSGTLQFEYDLTLLTVDSLGPPLGGNTIENISSAIDMEAANFTVTILPDSDQITIEPSYYHLGDIYAVANDSMAGEARIAPVNDSGKFYLVLADSVHRTPFMSGGEIDISGVTSVDDWNDGNVPVTFFLAQNSPNPFNGTTTITYGLKRSGMVRLEIFNILGQRVTVLTDDYLPAGLHSTGWNGNDVDSREMASGIYFYKLLTPGYSAVKKMVYLK
jgi:hypothetical protein